MILCNLIRDEPAELIIVAPVWVLKVERALLRAARSVRDLEDVPFATFWPGDAAAAVGVAFSPEG